MPIITYAGEQLIASNIASNTVFVIDSMVFAYFPSLNPSADVDRKQGMPSSTNIKHTATNISAGYVNTNEVVYSVVLDSIVGNFDFNWIGLVSGNTLVAVTTTPTLTKFKTQANITGNSIVRNFALRFSGAQSLSGVNVPAATWQVDFSNQIEKITPFQSNSDFKNGTLVTTDIDVAVTSDDSFMMKITGKSYTEPDPPFSILLQGNVYKNAIIIFGAISNGGYFNADIKMLKNSKNKLCFWWPRLRYMQSFNVYVYKTTIESAIPVNHVTDITDAAEPSSSQKVTCEVAQIFASGNKYFDKTKVGRLNVNYMNAGPKIVRVYVSVKSEKQFYLNVNNASGRYIHASSIADTNFSTVVGYVNPGDSYYISGRSLIKADVQEWYEWG